LASSADEGRGLAAISSGQLLANATGDLRMGQPSPRDGGLPRKRRQVAELKHLSKPKKRDYSLSSGERTGISPNLVCANTLGVVGLPQKSEKPTVRRMALGRPTKEGESPVVENPRLW
jgi:hypothetical protein